MSKQFDLVTWTFTKGENVFRLSAIFDMSEAEARKRFAARNQIDLDGFTVRRTIKKVDVLDPPELDEKGDPIKKKWRVTLSRTQTMEVEVEAETEEEARKEARETASDSGSSDWETEDSGIEGVQALGKVADA